MRTRSRAVAHPAPNAIQERRRSKSAPPSPNSAAGPARWGWEGKSIHFTKYNQTGKIADEKTKSLQEIYEILQSTPPKKARDNRPDLSTTVMDEIWNKLVELCGNGVDERIDGIFFESLYTNLPNFKSYLLHTFCNVGLYKTASSKYRLNVSLIPIHAADDDAEDDEDEDDDATPQDVGTEAGGESPTADDNPESNKDADDEDDTIVAPPLGGNSPAADDMDSNENVDDEVPTLVSEDNSDKSGAKDDSGKSEIELDRGTEDDSEPEKSSGTPKTDDGGGRTDIPKDDADNESGKSTGGSEFDPPASQFGAGTKNKDGGGRTDIPKDDADNESGKSTGGSEFDPPASQFGAGTKNKDGGGRTDIPKDDADNESGKSTGGSEFETPAASQFSAGTKKDDDSESEKSTGELGAKHGVGAEADDATLIPIEMLQKLGQLRIVVEEFNSPPGKLDERSFTVAKEHVVAATVFIDEVKTTIDDSTTEGTTDALTKVALRARALRCISIFQIGNYKLAAEECMDVLATSSNATSLNDEALATTFRKCFCWSSLGNGDGSSRAYNMVFNSLNDNESVPDLRAMKAVNNLSKEVSKAVNDLNRGKHLAPSKVALQKALKKANEFLDTLPGSTIMQVNKVRFLSQLGSWSELQSYLEDVADKTSNQVSIFTGDLESKGPFPAPDQRLLEGAHSVVQNLLDVHLAMSYSRSLVFGNQLDVAKSLLLDVSGPNLSVDEEGQKLWNRWRAQEISNVFMVDDRLPEVLEPTDISYHELQKCAGIKWAAIFPNDPPTGAQGDLLTVFHARECILDYEQMASCHELELKVDDLNKANKLAKAVLHAHGYSPHGALDTEKPFPGELATPTIVELLEARAKVLPRFGLHWHASKDYAFLLQLAAEKQHGLGSQLMAFEQQLEANLTACPHQAVLGLQRKDPLPGLRELRSLIRERKRLYHGDKNNGSAWCKFFLHRLDAIVDEDE